MTQSNTLKARVQLKTDTEANWALVHSTFIPLDGELIIYSADDTHSYSRLKVGDGHSPLNSLQFIDAGTINGEGLPSSAVVCYESRSSFPSPGETNKLYVDLETNTIYCFTNANGYTQLSNFSYDFTLNVTKTNAAVINSWSQGAMTRATVSKGILNIDIGTAPYLSYYSTQVVKDVSKE